MKIEIKNRIDGSVIFSHEREGNSIKITVIEAINAGVDMYSADLRGADLRGANLCSVNLSDADMRNANLSGADLCCANLRDTDLRDTDLRNSKMLGANLYGADLIGANLYGDNLTKNPLFLFNLRWNVVVTTNILQIGCQIHPISDWRSFDDDKISSMSPDALEFWRKNKVAILTLCDAHCAE